MDIKKDSPIAPIYNSLDQLLQYNKGLLKLFRKSKAPGLLQAIWGSRDGEIETLRRQLNDSQEKLNAYRKEKYKHQKRECEDKSEIKALMQLVSELHQKNSQDQDKIHSLQNKLDQVSEKINSQEYQKVFQIEKKLRISYLGISRLEEERKRLYKELDSEKEKVRLMNLEKEKYQAQHGHERKLNQKMQAEVLRLNQILKSAWPLEKASSSSPNNSYTNRRKAHSDSRP